MLDALHTACRHSVLLLDTLPRTPERSDHKFKMIRGSELTAAAVRNGTDIPSAELADIGIDVEAAVKFLRSKGIE